MTDNTEHRGWEIEDNYEPHPLDDPDYDIARHGQEGCGARFYSLLAFAGLLGGSLLGLHWYLQPPIVKFPTPVVVVENPVSAPIILQTGQAGTISYDIKRPPAGSCLSWGSDGRFHPTTCGAK
jgi:hypothetical protein